jgi:phage protein D
MPPIILSPRPTLYLEGQVCEAASNDLIHLSVEEALNKPARCEAILNNWGANPNPGYLYLERDLIDFGKHLLVSIEVSSIFNGRISAIEAIYPEGTPPQLRAIAEDPLRDLQMTRRTRTFSEMSLTDIIGRIASDHGLGLLIDIPSFTLNVTQLNESDLAFLTNLCERFALRFRISDQALEVLGDLASGDPVSLAFGSSLRSFRVLADTAQQCSSLTVSGWSVNEKNVIDYRETGDTIQGELSTGQTSGADILSSSTGTREEFIAYQSSSSEEIQAMAEAAFAGRARRFVTGSGLVEGDPRLRAGGLVNITGLGGPMFNGQYALTRVCHRYDRSSGYTTEIETCRPSIGPNNSRRARTTRTRRSARAKKPTTTS